MYLRIKKGHPRIDENIGPGIFFGLGTELATKMSRRRNCDERKDGLPGMYSWHVMAPVRYGTRNGWQQ